MSAKSFDITKTTKQSIIRVLREPNSIKVILYDTNVFELIDNYKVSLNSGGYKSVTTKRAINRAFQQTSPDYKVIQKKGEWFLVNNSSGVVVPFVDYMRVIL